MFFDNENKELYKWVTISSFCSALPIIFIKLFFIFDYNSFILIAIFFQLAATVSYIKLFSMGDILLLFVLVKLFSVLIVFIASIVFFKTKLTLRTILGISFAIASIYLLE